MSKLTLVDLNRNLASARSRAVEKGSRQEFGIQDGLRVRVYPSGKASFAYRFRAPGSSTLRTMVLSAIGDKVTRAELDDVLEQHRSKRRERDDAVDPLTKRQLERIAAAEQESKIKADKADREYTVRRLANDYVSEMSERKRSWKEDQRIFDRYIVPYIGDKSVVDVSAKDVRRVLGNLSKTPIMRDRTLACARHAWNWKDPLSLNPWTIEKIPTRPAKDRVLSLLELRELLGRIDSGEGTGSDIVHLILLTGARREEASGARRDEFDGNQWHIPESRMKGKAAHIVLLSNQAVELTQRVLESHDSEWLFPSRRTNGPLAPEYGYKWLKADGADYSLHDLRRTMSSWMGEQLIADAVIDRVLAHSKRGVIRHYNLAKLKQPAADAWQRWADSLDELRDPNVARIGLLG